MRSTAYYAAPSGHVKELSGDTWEHQSFQDQHKPQGWRGPFPDRGVAETVAQGMAARDVSGEVADVTGTDPSLGEQLNLAVAIARVEALEDAYDALDGKDYEPINGIYPEGHIAQLLNAARRDLDTLNAASGAASGAKA